MSFDTHQIAPQGRITRQVELRNVMAVLPGKSPRRIYVSGHYDSLNLGERGQAGLNTGAGANPQASAEFNHDVEAPGANDDGSGTVLTMELARVFAESGVEFDATLVFICWAGEEQGLIGSAAHAQDLAADKAVVEAMFNNDIVGNSHGGNGVVDAESVRVYAVGPEDSMARSLARYIARDRGGLRAVAPRSPDGARGSLWPRQRPVVVHAERLSGHRVPRSRTRTSASSTPPTTRSMAWTSPTSRRTRA